MAPRGSTGHVFAFLWKRPWADKALSLCGQRDVRSGAWQLLRGCCSSTLQGMGRHKKTDFKGPQTFYQQEPGTRGLLPPYVQLSLVTVPSHVHLQMGCPPSKRSRGRRHQRGKSGERLQGPWMEGKEGSGASAVNGPGRVDSSNSRMGAH